MVQPDRRRSTKRKTARVVSADLTPLKRGGADPAGHARCFFLAICRREGGFSMPKTTIRPAEQTDLPAILALYRLLDEEMVDLQPEFFCAAPREEAPILQFIEAPDADFLLAEQEGTVVGFALVVYAGWTPEFSCVLPHRYAGLYDLVVAREHRRRGIGSALLGAAKRWARDRRLEYLELGVLSQNSAAIHLYESHDFVEARRTLRCML